MNFSYMSILWRSHANDSCSLSKDRLNWEVCQRERHLAIKIQFFSLLGIIKLHVLCFLSNKASRFWAKYHLMLRQCSNPIIYNFQKENGPVTDGQLVASFTHFCVFLLASGLFWPLFIFPILMIVKWKVFTAMNFHFCMFLLSFYIKVFFPQCLIERPSKIVWSFFWFCLIISTIAAIFE